MSTRRSEGVVVVAESRAGAGDHDGILEIADIATYPAIVIAQPPALFDIYM
jgi:hypothetical protein